MIFTITQYGSFRTDVGFLRFKQEYLSNDLWLAGFYIHVFSCFVCLFAGFTQFSSSILRKKRSLHKVLGKIYAYNILLVNFPAGLILAIHANGHLPSKIAFIILDILWFSFTMISVISIKNGDEKRHREFMIRSYALTLSALTLRLWKLVFVSFTALDDSTIYMIDAWMGFVPNLLLAEWIILRNRKILSPQRYIINNDQEGDKPEQ